MEDYEFYHTDNGKFTNDAMMPIDGVYDFDEFMQQQACFDLMEHYDYYRFKGETMPQYIDENVITHTNFQREL